MLINYTDKTNLDTQPSVPLANKVTDDDMNEIKTVVNANAGLLEDITGEIVWSNPSPTSAFASQTITFNANDCDLFLWLFKRTSGL